MAFPGKIEEMSCILCSHPSLVDTSLSSGLLTLGLVIAVLTALPNMLHTSPSTKGGTAGALFAGYKKVGENTDKKISEMSFACRCTLKCRSTAKKTQM